MARCRSPARPLISKLVKSRMVAIELGSCVLACSGLKDHAVELYLWNRRLAPVSAAVMVLHRKDAVVAPTAWREVCHRVCRACTVVARRRHLLRMSRVAAFPASSNRTNRRHHANADAQRCARMQRPPKHVQMMIRVVILPI